MFGKKPYLVFCFKAFNGITKEGALIDDCQVEIIDTEAKHAEERAKFLSKRETAKLVVIIEKF